jgi:hypothetical protein
LILTGYAEPTPLLALAAGLITLGMLVGSGRLSGRRGAG